MPGPEALGVIRKVLTHVWDQRGPLLLAGVPCFLFMAAHDMAIPAEGPWELTLWAILFACQLWLSIAFGVFCHRLVLFPLEKPKLRWRWTRTEWRFLGYFVLVGFIPSIAWSSALEYIDRVFFDRWTFLFVGIMSLCVYFIVVAPMVLSAPIVVAGGNKPIGLSWILFLKRIGLCVTLFAGAGILFVSIGALLEVVQFGITGGDEALSRLTRAPFVFMASAFAVVEIAIGASGLSFLYLRLWESDEGVLSPT